MCYLCEHVAPLEIPAQGLYLSDAGRLTFMGNDAVRVAAMLPNAIPARGYVAIHKTRNGVWRARRLDALTLADAKRTALEMGRHSVTPVVLGEVAKMGGDPFSPVFMISAVSLFEPVTKGDLLRKAIEAADDITDNLKLLRVEKASKKDPFSKVGFDTYAANLVKALEQNLGTLPQDAINSVISGSGINFAAASEEQIKQFANKMNAAMRGALGTKEWTSVQNSFEVHHNRVRKGTVEKVVDKYNLGVSTGLDLKDKRAIARSASARTTFVRDFYNGQICPKTSDRAKRIVREGMEQGYGSREIGREMRRELGRYVQEQNRDYFNVVADAAVARAREHTAMTKYAEAGVSVVLLSSVLDEATTETCRWLDGKVLEVEHCMQKYNQMDEANPEEVKWRLPWMREKTLTDGPNAGKRAIFMAREKGWRQVAVVHKPAIGTQGTGSYKGYGMPQMQKLGLGPPPYHGHCRTTTVPDVSYHPVVQQELPGMRNPRVPDQRKQPKQMPRPRKKIVGPQAMLDEKLMGTHGGQALPLDAEDIENQVVRFRKERDKQGEYYVVSFRVPAARGVQMRSDMKRQGAKQKSHAFKKAKPGDTKKPIQRTGEYSSIGTTVLEQKSGKSIVRLHSDSGQFAMENRVEIKVRTGDPKAAFAEYQRVMQDLKVKDATAFPSPQAARAAMQARLITQWDKNAAQTLSGMRKIDPAEIDKLYEQASKRNPGMRKALKDMEKREVFPGHQAFYSEAQAKEAQKGGVKFLYHEATDPAAVGHVFGGDGLMSSVNRFDRGVFTTGMSTSSDFRTGGASGVFVRASAQANPGGKRGFYNYGPVRFIIDPKQLGRTDWWAYNSDSFGQTGRQSLGGRSYVKDVGGPKQYNGRSNEIMFEQGIPKEAIKGVYVRGTTTRRKVLADLKARGIKEINGTPIEKFVKLGGD